MALHVDVIKNEWAAGIQHRVAAVSIVKGDIQVDAGDPVGWRETVMRTVADVDPRGNVRGFLGALHERLSGSYLFATEPHDERTCPYSANPVQYIQPVGGIGSAARRQPTPT